jgi:hypothetical protein
MVSKKLLKIVSSRLAQIKGSHINKAIWKPTNLSSTVKGARLYDVDSSALPPELWRNFERWELTQIMRQKNDIHFASLLNRMRLHSKDSQQRHNDD